MTEKNDKSAPDVMGEIQRRNAAKIDSMANVPSNEESPENTLSSSEPLATKNTSEDDLDFEEEIEEAPIVSSSPPATRKPGRPSKPEVVEPRRRLQCDIPKSLDDRIQEFLKAPLPGINDKTAITIAALTFYLDQTDKTRKKVANLLRKSMPGSM